MKKAPQNLNQPQESISWSLKCRFKNGLEECYPIAASEKDYLWDRLLNICEQKGVNFVEFSSRSHRILIQSSQLMFFQFLFEPSCLPYPQNLDEDPYAVKIYFADNPSPMILQVEEDEPDPNDEGDQGEISNFIFYASHADDEEWLHFTDEDGETAFFRAASLALVKIPLKVIENAEALWEERYGHEAYPSHSTLQ